MSAINFLQALLDVAEKAANIARACRREHELFKLLVEEKSNEEKNKRFLQDFKTLADVLIQETVKHDLVEKFPELRGHINGEESNTFTNTLGESISVQVSADQGATSALLAKVLDGDVTAADLLAKEVHQQAKVMEKFQAPLTALELPVNELGIWIDPIDSTAEYIQGEPCKPGPHGIYASGLRCATVLIGAFLRSTGRPVVGVVNQPFHRQLDDDSWQGQHFWGVSYEGVNISSITGAPSIPVGIALLSGSEGELLRNRLLSRYSVVEAAGAGYKQLCVALGLADVYILSRGSTYRWDSCAPQAVLSSLGGGVLNYGQLIKADRCPDQGDDSLAVKYHEPGKSQWCNDDGIVAFSSHASLLELYNLLKNHQ